jgi:hypothetical protein
MKLENGSSDLYLIKTLQTPTLSAHSLRELYTLLIKYLASFYITCIRFFIPKKKLSGILSHVQHMKPFDGISTADGWTVRIGQ